MVERKPRTDPEKNSGYQSRRREQGGATADAPPSLGEAIAYHRRRRGISQEVLAGLAGGRTADWLSKVERGRIAIDRLSVLEQLADALRIPASRLIDRVGTRAIAVPSPKQDLDRLRGTLADYGYLTAENAAESADIDLGVLGAEIGETWSAYQDSHYTRATRRLPDAITRARVAARTLDGREKALAQAHLAMAYQGAAMVLTKIGEAELAWLAADRGLSAAFAADDRLVLGSLYRSVAHCLLANKQMDAAAATIDTAVALTAPHAGHGPDHLSIYGTLFLVGAMAAARAGERRETGRYLTHAGHAAQQLGHDGNRMWTSFGPTTVAMHHVSTALELDDIETAIAQGERIDTSGLPAERRVRHKLDLARAHDARGHRHTAQALLLDANNLAPQQVGSHYITAALLHTWVRSPKDTPNPRIATLAQKLGIV